MSMARRPWPRCWPPASTAPTGARAATMVEYATLL